MDLQPLADNLTTAKEQIVEKKDNMVLGLLSAVAACPAIIGTTEAVRQGQKKNAKEKHRSQKSNLVVHCSAKSSKRAQIDDGLVVLRNNKVCFPSISYTKPMSFLFSWGSHLSVPPQLFIDVPAEEGLEFEKPSSHPFAGYFMKHPQYNWGWQGEGLVSTIMDDPPQLNWIYVDEETHEVKYGNKVESEGHHMGPWDCTKTDHRMLFEGWEGFLAVKEGADTWALYFDRNDDGLKGVEMVEGKRKLEIELTKKERHKTKEHADEKDYI